MAAYKKAHGSKKRALANIRDTKAEVSKNELSKLKDDVTKEIQEIKRSWVPRQDKDTDKDNDKDNKGTGRWRKKVGEVSEVTAEENTPTSDAP